MSLVLRALFIALLVTLIVITGCNGAPAVRGSGVVASETRDVGSVTEVQVAGVGEVTVEQADAEALSVEAEDNILPLLETTVANGVLHLGTKPNTSISPTRPIRYTVKVKALTGVGISGSGSVRATAISTDRLAARISGSGSAHLSGRADTAEIVISGSGSIDAAGLQCSAVNITVTGSGDATIHAAQRLDATISGSGSVRYAGNPTVSRQISGSGSISPLPGK